MKLKSIILFFLFLSSEAFSQTFAYSGYVYNANGSGAVNVPVKLYKRTTPTLTGFTSQTNYNGHSYYRSTSSATWTNAKSTCESMGGHLATISDASENNFLYNTWPSGWIGLYQDKTGAFYSEPNGGWRWTENDITDYKHNFDTKNYTTTLIDNVGSKNATMFNSPSLTTSGGNYLQFNGSTQYAITGDLSASFPNSQETQTISMLCYPSDPGVLASELGTGSASSGWHESIIEITTSGTLKVGFWNGTGISNISTSITMNSWNLITMTYDSSTLRGYLNGVLFGSITFNRDVPHAYSGNGMYYALGKSDATNMGDGTYANFRLGYFRVFNRVLSEDEISRSWMHISYRYGRMKYLNWNGGEPNNSGSEDYIQFVSLGKWNDLPNTTLPYVIEFDYIPTTTAWTLHQTVYTNSSGYWNISQSTTPATEWYIQIDANTPVSILQQSDLNSVGNVILGVTPIKSLNWHMYDVNNDGRITISDKYYISAKKQGIFPNWVSTQPSGIYTSSQYNTLLNGTTNQKSTYPGLSSYTINSPVNGGSLNLYMIAPGYGGQVNY